MHLILGKNNGAIEKITKGLFKMTDYTVHQKISEPKFKLYFNGYELTLFFKDNKFIYPAVSGRPKEDNEKLVFDYSEERQGMANIGPIPEGEYFILSNEIQKMSELSIIDKAIVDTSVITTPLGIKLGRFPGGYYSWRSVRTRIYKI